MPRRGDNIRKRKDGRWEARYKKGVNEKGNAVYGSVYGSSYYEVREKRDQILQENYTGRTISVGNSKLFRDVVLLWENSNRIRLKGATKCKYHYLIDTHILPELGNRKISQLTSSQINAFLADKLDHGRLDGRGGLSPAYVRSMMLIINAVMKFAAIENMCEPLRSGILKPSVISKEPPILSVADQKKLEAVLLTNPDETKLGILISLYAGLRIGEVCALTWNDIDLPNRVMYVRHTVARVSNEGENGNVSSKLIIDTPKTASSLRCIPICSTLHTALSNFPVHSQEKYVVSKDDGFVSPRTYEYRYHKLLQESDVQRVNYHALRHTFATRCIEAGVDVKSLSEILGHSDVAITLNTYVHSSMELKRLQLEKITV